MISLEDGAARFLHPVDASPLHELGEDDAGRLRRHGQGPVVLHDLQAHDAVGQDVLERLILLREDLLEPVRRRDREQDLAEKAVAIRVLLRRARQL